MKILLLWKFFALAFSALLPLVNPLGSSLLFVGFVGEVPISLYHSLARRIAINILIFFAVILLLGSALLTFFGISLPIVQVSGGIVIAAIGWSLLNENDARANVKNKQAEMEAQADAGVRDLEQKTFYPFTFPVTSGPGTLVVMLTLSAHASDPVLSKNVLGHLGIFLAVIVLSVLVYVCYAYAPKITSSISESTAHGILRVVAFILLSIGVQIAWNGLSVLLASVLKR